MEKNSTTKAAINSDQKTDLYMHKKLVMEKIYKSDIYKEFISQWDDPVIRTAVIDGIGMRKKV